MNPTHPLTIDEVRCLLSEYRDDYAALSFAVAADKQGELAYYDRVDGTLHVNGPLLHLAPDWAAYFYLFKALRHAQQCCHPERFDPAVVRSLDYAFPAVGVCARWDGGGWRTCRIEGDAAFFEAAERNLPCLIEAIEYATNEAFDMLSNDLDRDNLHVLAQMMAPTRAFTAAQYDDLFAAIDQSIANVGHSLDKRRPDSVC